MMYDGPISVTGGSFWNFTSMGTNGFCAFAPRFAGNNFQMAPTTGERFVCPFVFSRLAHSLAL